METKHTPGPWQLSTIPFELRNTDSAASIYGPSSIENGACLIADISRSAGDEKSSCNAKLIAAAPELLEACIAVKKILLKRGITYDDADNYNLLNAAIKKATE